METRKSYQISGICFEPETGMLAMGATSCRLEPKAAGVLAALCADRGKLVTRNQLLDMAWAQSEGTDEGLTQAIAQVRRALETLGAPPNAIVTFPKRGYRLNSEDTRGEGGLEAPPPAFIKTNPAYRSASLARFWLPAIAVLLVVFLSTISMAPHWPRHLFRHALGLGPHQTVQSNY